MIFTNVFDQIGRSARLSAFDRFSNAEGAHGSCRAKNWRRFSSLRAFDPVRCAKTHGQELFIAGDVAAICMAADEVNKDQGPLLDSHDCALPMLKHSISQDSAERSSAETDPEKRPIHCGRPARGERRLTPMTERFVFFAIAERSRLQYRFVRPADAVARESQRRIELGTLTRQRPKTAAFFTAVGWRSWAVCMAKVGRWEEAALRLCGLESHWHGMPALVVCGRDHQRCPLCCPASIERWHLTHRLSIRGIRP